MKTLFKNPLIIMTALLLLLFSCDKEDGLQPYAQMKIPGMNEAQKELFSIGEGIHDLCLQPGFRTTLYDQIEKKFDGDYNVLIRDIELNYPDMAHMKSASVKSALEYFRQMKSFPQVFIPFYEDLKKEGKISREEPVIVIFTDENESGEYPGFRFDQNGKLNQMDFLISENYARNHEVWVISVNERVDGTGKVVYKAPDPEFFSKIMPLPNTIGDLQSGRLKSALACATPPAIPSNVQVFPKVPSQINIEWQGVSNALTYKVFREVNNSGIFGELTQLNHPNSTYADKYLTPGIHYRYKIQALNGDDCYSPLSYSSGAYASWRTNDYFEILYQIYLSDVCWAWCCSWPEGDIELKYRLVKYNKTDQMVEYPMNQLPQKSKSAQKGKWCTYNKELFRWDITRYAYNYMLFLYEDDGGDDKGITIKLSAKFAPTDDISVGAEVSFTIDDRDEELGWVEIFHYDPWSKVYYLSPRKGSAKLTIRQ